MAAMVTFRVTGVNSVFNRSAKFRRAVEKMPESLYEYALAIGEMTKEIAEKNTPVRTGTTRESYDLTVGGSGTRFFIHLENTAKSFEYLVGGHRAFVERPSNAYALLVGGEGSDLLRMWAKIPAQPPNPIMEKTMAEVRPLMKVELAKFKATMIAML